MRKVYLNRRFNSVRTTVDELQRERGESEGEFVLRVKDTILEYAIKGVRVYQSQEPCFNWE